MATIIRGSNTFVWDTSRILGQGATSIVYMGRNKKTGDEVAVKVFNSQSYQRATSVQHREFEVMTKLNHTNIVKLLAIEEEIPSRAKVIVMEYCTNGTLFSLLDAPENYFGLPDDEFLRFLSQVTAGMKHLRDNNIIHRDIKPGNILRSVEEDGRSVFKLTDFGAARELEQDEEFLSLYGTAEYLHPNMYAHAVLRRPRSQQYGLYVDLWSLGVTIYHTAAGSLPFRPYGGRRNKETMHIITTQKDHGVISGVQETDGGPIKWSRDLPPTCKLSRGLKAMITPFLAVLLEKEPSHTISFDDYFERVKDITTRIPYHVFCPSTCSRLTIYARPTDDMSQFRQLITDQTDIPGGAQLLMLEGKQLESETRQPVSLSLTHVSAENPIFVFNKLPEFKNYTRPAVNRFPDIPPEMNVATDYGLSKECLVVLHAARHAVTSIIQTNKLLNQAVKMYSNHIRHRSTEMELSMGHINRAASDAMAWKDQLFFSLGLEVTLCQALSQEVHPPNGVDVQGRVKMLHTLLQTGSRECGNGIAYIQSRLDKATSILQDIKVGQTVDNGWDPSVGCPPENRCIEKMDVLVTKMQKIMTSFRDNRKNRTLNNNDEQIHKFDKNRLKELCVTAQTLLEDHCIKRAHQLFNTYKQFYCKAVQIHDAGERLEVLVADISKQQKRLVDKLKATHKQCVSQAESCLQAVSHMNGTNSNDQGSGDGQDKQSGLSRQSRLDNVLDSLQSTRSSLHELKTLLDENSSMMEMFSSLQLNSTDEDGEKSWEYVP